MPSTCLCNLCLKQSREPEDAAATEHPPEDVAAVPVRLVPRVPAFAAEHGRTF